MSLVTSIYKAPIVDTDFYDGLTGVCIKWNGQLYWGSSSCNDEDKDFQSNFVGQNIALSRARLEAMYAAKRSIEDEVKWKLRIYQEVTRGKGCLENLPSPEVWRNYERAEKRLKSIKSAIKNEKVSLQEYIDGQAKAIESVRKFRDKGKNS
jgi:hypothetical protein